MKRFFYLFLLFLLTFPSVKAQTDRWDIDAFVGFASTTFDYKGFRDIQGTDMKFGAGVKYYFSPAWSVNSGVYFLWKHTSDGDAIPDVSAEVQYLKLRYWRIPLCVGYTFRFANGFSCMPEIGAVMDYGISGRIISFRTVGYEAGGDWGTLDVSAFSAKPGALLRPLKRVDWSLMAGVHLKYRRFGVKASYQHGLTDLKGVYPYGTKTRTFNLGATYTLFR